MIPVENKQPPNSIPLAAFPAGRASEVRVSLDIFDGRRFLNLRLWYVPRGGDWKPTIKGTTIGIEYLSALRDAVTKALELGIGS